jgi:hypothetical protein
VRTRRKKSAGCAAAIGVGGQWEGRLGAHGPKLESEGEKPSMTTAAADYAITQSQAGGGPHTGMHEMNAHGSVQSSEHARLELPLAWQQSKYCY